jgi:hypothetical protein
MHSTHSHTPCEQEQTEQLSSTDLVPIGECGARRGHITPMRGDDEAVVYRPSDLLAGSVNDRSMDVRIEGSITHANPTHPLTWGVSNRSLE